MDYIRLRRELDNLKPGDPAWIIPVLELSVQEVKVTKNEPIATEERMCPSRLVALELLLEQLDAAQRKTQELFYEEKERVAQAMAEEDEGITP